MGGNLVVDKTLRKLHKATTSRDNDISYNRYQRWSPRKRPWPRGYILKSLALALASKVKSLASRPQVLKNWPVLDSRTALFFELLKFCGALEKFFGNVFSWRSPEKFLRRPFFFFWRALALVSLALGLEHSCPWPRECLSSERLSLASDFFCVLDLGLGLEPCVLDSTSDRYLLLVERGKGCNSHCQQISVGKGRAKIRTIKKQREKRVGKELRII